MGDCNQREESRTKIQGSSVFEKIAEKQQKQSIQTIGDATNLRAVASGLQDEKAL